jgi:hypothetical protein
MEVPQRKVVAGNPDYENDYVYRSELPNWADSVVGESTDPLAIARAGFAQDDRRDQAGAGESQTTATRNGRAESGPKRCRRNPRFTRAERKQHQLNP